MKIINRKYIPADGLLAARYIEKETGDTILLYHVDKTIRVRIPKSEINNPYAAIAPSRMPKYKSKKRKKNNANL